MTTAQELVDYEQAALTSFESAIRESSAEAQLNREVARLEGKFEQLHNVAVMAARRAEAAEEIAALWQTMMQICERFAQKIQTLVQAHPGCQASYDKVLDLLSDCQKRHAFHA